MFGQGLDCLKPCYLSLKKINPSVYKRFPSVYIRVPCGKCTNCKIRRTKEWSLRLAMEATQWEDIQFVTLTFSNDYVYIENRVTGELKESLMIRDIQLYIKRVRTELFRAGWHFPIKYYAVGEYGPRTNRPHYHLLVFGVPKYIGPIILNDCWKYGFTYIKDFVPQQCNYVAGYIQKKLYGDERKYLYDGVEPPFNVQSQHLGEAWFFDEKNLENTLENGFVMFQGYKHAIPATFRRKLIKQGRLSACDLVDLRNVQISEYKLLYKHCLDIGMSPKEYWLNFIAEAQRKVMKKNTLRDKEIMSV